jgi:DMSO/TMAO reductase YedYZ heme-binding membrane subunit
MKVSNHIETATPREKGVAMKRGARVRFWIEAALATASGLLFVLTLVWRDWIEATTGYDPDHHAGSAEWAIVAVLLVAMLVFSLLARMHWKKRLPEQAATPQTSVS